MFPLCLEPVWSVSLTSSGQGLCLWHLQLQLLKMILYDRPCHLYQIEWYGCMMYLMSSLCTICTPWNLNHGLCRANSWSVDSTIELTHRWLFKLYYLTVCSLNILQKKSIIPFHWTTETFNYKLWLLLKVKIVCLQLTTNKAVYSLKLLIGIASKYTYILVRSFCKT